MLSKLHHVAYRCRDAQETTDFYENVLGLRLAHTIREEEYRGKYCPYLHIFFEMQDGSYIAFFDLPTYNEHDWGVNTPRWVQHLALEVENDAIRDVIAKRLEERGIPFELKDGYTVHSIYFFDPSGNRIEVGVAKQLDRESAAKAAIDDLAEWNIQKQRYREPITTSS